VSDFAANSPSISVKKNYLLTGTNPPQWLSAEQVAALARQANYQPKRLAREIGLNARTFERRFRRAFGAAPRVWLAGQRMTDAVALLELGYNAKQVAAAVAFRHLPSFVRKFRLEMGITPKVFAGREMSGPGLLPDPIRGGVSQLANILSQSANSGSLQLSAAD
jgi:AraC-like DNA-binding protein